MRTRKPFYDENRKFTAAKFTFKLSSGAVANRPKPCETTSVACAFCGSVKVLAGAESKKKISFCDRQCRGGWVSQNLEKSNFSGVLARNKKRLADSLPHRMQRDNQKQMDRIAKQHHRSWRCCSWCDNAFKAVMGGVTCSKSCNSKLRYVRRRSIKPTPVTCAYCNEVRLAGTIGESLKKFCSVRCKKRAGKERRDHWIRSNGPCEYIPLEKLIERDKGKCLNCKCKVTRYNGKLRPTDASIDHIMPLAKGGYHCWSNVQLLCHQCNSLKSDSLDDQAQMMLPRDNTPSGGVNCTTL